MESVKKIRKKDRKHKKEQNFEIIELKTTVTEQLSAIESFNSRLDFTEERISRLEGRLLEIILSD